MLVITFLQTMINANLQNTVVSQVKMTPENLEIHKKHQVITITSTIIKFCIQQLTFER